MYCELEDELPNKRRTVEGGSDEGDDCDDDDVLSPTKQAECKPKYLLCDIPTEPSTGQGKKCVKTADGSESETRILKPWFHSISRGKLEVHTLPIGQGDCNIIYCPNNKDAVLFDCGSTSSRNDPRLSPKFIREKFLSSIQHLTIMLSHGDQDHYNFLPHLFSMSDTTVW